ncbi:MAG TPA: DUF1405 domain-containing protein [Bacillota bacterium]|nr:DUF1405 domain-containing protein [Bacillota bacterium]
MNTAAVIWKDFLRDPWQARFSIPLIIINASGSVFGYLWYRGQLAGTPFYFWPFVPDSPLAVTFFASALALGMAGAVNPLFQSIAVTAPIKYGVWATVVIVHYWLGGGPVESVEVMLMLSHIGMFVEGAVFLRSMQFGLPVVLSTWAWMFINDIMDYAAGLHPFLFAEGQESLAFFAAFLLTFAIVVYMWIYGMKGRNTAPVLEKRGE